MLLKEILYRQRDNNKIAVEYKDKVLSYKQIYDTVLDKELLIKTHIDDLANVGLFINNSSDYVIGYFVISSLNKVIVPIEKDIKKNQIQSIIKYCELKMIITNENNVLKLKEMLKDFKYKIKIFNISNNSISIIGGEQELFSSDKKSNDNENDTAIMLHTSGTTSEPKKVMLTHKNLICNVESNIYSLNLNKDDICLIVLPMFFGYCNSSQFLTHFYLGAKIVIYDSVFIPDKFLKIIEEKRCTNTTCVPSMLFMTVKFGKKSYSTDSLRYLCFGGGVMPVDMLNKVMVFFNKTGVVQTYGQTEASPRVTVLLPEDSVRKIGSVGKPIPNVQVKIVDDLDRPVPNNQIGEIIVNGPNVMKGYYKRPKETAFAKRNGWLHTGDLGRLDDEGFLYIVGRKKNLIISGGLNIYPEEIEEVLINNPAIKEVMVVGESHEILGEVPIAKVILYDEYSISKDDIVKFCAEKLENYKIPSKVIICSEFEKTYTGKIKRINYSKG